MGRLDRQKWKDNRQNGWTICMLVHSMNKNIHKLLGKQVRNKMKWRYVK